MKTKVRTLKICILMVLLFVLASIVCFATVPKIADASTESPDLKFTLINGGAEYKVSAANKNIISAIIPSEYNGLPVVEIADNAFMLCRSLEEVFVSSSVKKIGNNAFMNATKLKNITGMAGVTSYGANAFSSCTSLEYLIMPADVAYLGDSVIKNLNCTIYARANEEEMNAINANWNYDGNIEFGNGIVYQQCTYQGENGYKIVSYQNIKDTPEDLVINSWVESNKEDVPSGKLLQIDGLAFAESALKSITLQYSNENDHSIHIEPYAFAGADVETINIKTKIAIESTEEAYQDCEGLFLSSTVQFITLPNTFTSISKYMFSDCRNLSQINFVPNSNINIDNEINYTCLPNEITSIQDEAFVNCYNLNLQIPSSVNYIGNTAFGGWGTNEKLQHISIDKFEEESEDWGLLWENDIEFSNCSLIFTAARELTVNFIVDQNGVENPIGANSIKVARNQSLSNINIPNPESKSHNFNGKWYTTKSRDEGSEYDLSKPVTGNLSLYAGWQIKVFEISFSEYKYCSFYDFYTGNPINNHTLFIDYDKIYTFYIEPNVGYKNVKLYYNEEQISAVTGDAYSIQVTKSSVIKVSADLEHYAIKYSNLRNGTNPNENIWETYTIEDNVELLSPEWVAYTDATWDITGWIAGTHSGDITVNAIWSNPARFNITYTNLRGGTNPNAFSTYTIEDEIAFENPSWIAYKNSSWSISGWESGTHWGDISVKANWANPVAFKIVYANLRGGENLNQFDTYTVEEVVSFVNPIWAAYKNSTWNIKGWNPDTNWGDKTITAVWTNPNTYTITYTNLRKGTNPNTKTTYTVEDTVSFQAPQWAAYKNSTWNIKGWNPDTNWGDKTITAVWTNPNTYTITYTNLRKGTNPNTKTTYTVEDTVSFQAPQWAAYKNSGWSITGWAKDTYWKNMTINAVWTNPNTYTITYTNLRKGTHTNTKKTYTVEDTVTFQAPKWAAYKNSSWNITGWAKDTYWEDKTVTAVWTNPNTYTITYNLSNVINVQHNNTKKSYTVEDTVSLLNPTGEGYISLKWLKSGNVTTGWGKDTYWENIELVVKVVETRSFKIRFDLNGGSSTTISANEITVKYGDPLPVINVKPTKAKHEFRNFYSKNTGKIYYNSSLNRVCVWDQTQDDVLIARWEQVEFSLIIDNRGGTGGEEQLNYVYRGAYQLKETIKMPVRKGYVPKGYYYRYETETYKIYNADGTYNYNNIVGTGANRYFAIDMTLFCVWEKDERTVNFVIEKIHAMEDKATTWRIMTLSILDTISYTAPESDLYRELNSTGTSVTYQDTRLFTRWMMNLNGADNYANSPWQTMTTERTFTYTVEELINKYFPDYNYLPNPDAIHFRAIYATSPPSCVAEGSLVTLSDGTQKRVEQLTGNEQLLVWNLFTGTFDVAPILFIDCDPAQEYKIINLNFSDGTRVKVIDEHAFWDCDLNKYVFLRADAAKYIGHWFNKQTTNSDGKMIWTKVQLVNVELTTEITTVWSPVTYGHLCYYVNGMLSMPGATESFINIFDVDAETMKIDEVAFEQDIETYGLFTYEEFAELLPIPKVIFEAFGGQYLKVAIGKGLTTMEQLATLIQRYEKFFN